MLKMKRNYFERLLSPCFIAVSLCAKTTFKTMLWLMFDLAVRLPCHGYCLFIGLTIKKYPCYGCCK